MKFSQDCPIVQWRGKFYEVSPWVMELSPELGVVDGDLRLGEDNVITARMIADGYGPKPMTRAAKSVLNWAKACAMPVVNEDDWDRRDPLTYDFIYDVRCRCGLCR